MRLSNVVVAQVVEHENKKDNELVIVDDTTGAEVSLTQYEAAVLHAFYINVFLPSVSD